MSEVLARMKIILRRIVSALGRCDEPFSYPLTYEQMQDLERYERSAEWDRPTKNHRQ